MRTTLAIEEDVLAAPSAAAVAGFRPFAPEAGQLVNNEQIDQLRDAGGL